jgi:integrase
MSEPLLDRAGRRRSPATMPGFHAGRPPRNKGLRYPADPPKIEEIVAVMRAAGDRAHGRRLRGDDRDPLARGLAHRGGARARRSRSRSPPWRSARPPRQGRTPPRGRQGRMGGWEQLMPWLGLRVELPVGPLFCVINGPTRGRPWSSAAARAELRRTADAAGVRRRCAPHQLRRAHALAMAHEGVPLVVIQHRLGHSNLGITSIYLQGIDTPRSSTPSTPPRADDSRQRKAAALTTPRGRHRVSRIAVVAA